MMDKCKKVVHPLAKGAVDYTCTREHYADGWCKQHHPRLIAEREARKASVWEKHHAEIEKRKQDKQLVLTEIELAIVLLVQSGYRVEKINN